MKYICKECDYETNDRGNYHHHEKTKKHINNINNINGNLNKKIYECIYCKNNYNKKYNLNRHLLNCKIKEEVDNKIKSIKNEAEIEKNRLIEKFEMELRIKDIKNKSKLESKLIEKDYENKLSLKDKDIENIKLSAELKGLKETTISKPTSYSLSYVQNNYYNAPPIDYFSNFSLLKGNDKKSSIDDIMLYWFNKKSLASYLGKIIVSEYIKDNPFEQSVWVTDSSRRNLLLNETQKDKTTQWVIDKLGIKLSNYAIKPILNKIRYYLWSYIENATEKMKRKISVVNKMSNCHELIDYIDCVDKKKSLENDIIKFITPYIHLNKNNLLELNSCNSNDSNNNQIIIIDK